MLSTAKMDKNSTRKILLIFTFIVPGLVLILANVFGPELKIRPGDSSGLMGLLMAALGVNLLIVYIRKDKFPG